MPMTYIYVTSEYDRHNTVSRTIIIDDSTNVDVDEDGRVVGVEVFNDTQPNWVAILAHPELRFVR